MSENEKSVRTKDDLAEIPVVPSPEINNSIWFFGRVLGKTDDDLIKIQVIDNGNSSKNIWISRGNIISNIETIAKDFGPVEIKNSAVITINTAMQIAAQQFFSSMKANSANYDTSSQPTLTTRAMPTHAGHLSDDGGYVLEGSIGGGGGGYTLPASGYTISGGAPLYDNWGPGSTINSGNSAGVAPGNNGYGPGWGGGAVSGDPAGADISVGLIPAWRVIFQFSGQASSEYPWTTDYNEALDEYNGIVAKGASAKIISGHRRVKTTA